MRGVDLELLAHVVDVHVDRALVADGRLVPERREDLRSREGLARVLAQQLQDAVLRGRQVYRLATHADLARVDIEDEVAEGELSLLARALAHASQDRLDAADEFTWRERLGHVVVGTELEAEDAVDFIAAGREHDDGDVRGLADVAGKLEAALAREHHIEDEQVGLDLVHHHDSTLGSCGRVYLVALLLEGVRHDLEDRFLVIDRDDADSHALLRTPRSSPRQMRRASRTQSVVDSIMEYRVWWGERDALDSRRTATRPVPCRPSRLNCATRRSARGSVDTRVTWVSTRRRSRQNRQGR